MVAYQDDGYWWYVTTSLWDDCRERKEQVKKHFDCMKYLIPPMAGWNVIEKILSIDEERELTNYFADKYCVGDGVALVVYSRPPRHIEDYEAILRDECDGLTYVHGYNKLKFQYTDSPIPLNKIEETYRKDCSIHNYPSFCEAEYHLDHAGGTCTYYKKICITGEIICAQSNTQCKDSVPKFDYGRSFNIDYAKISALVYQDVSEIKKVTISNWKYLLCEQKGSGFFGCAFENIDYQGGKIIVVAFRGTELVDIGDLWTDLTIGMGGIIIPPQYKDAVEFYGRIQKIYKNGYSIVVTGHSLGGALAQLLAIKENIKAVTFDSPGIRNVASHLFSQKDMDLYGSASNIISYISEFNVVNAILPHIVDPIQIHNDIGIAYI